MPPSLHRANSAVDMRQLTSALLDAREGTGEVRAVLLRAAFRPRLPGAGAGCLSHWGSGCRMRVSSMQACAADFVSSLLSNPCVSCRLPLGSRAQSAAQPALPPTHPPPLASGLTKMVSRLGKEGAWRKALEVFEAVGEMG